MYAPAAEGADEANVLRDEQCQYVMPERLVMSHSHVDGHERAQDRDSPLVAVGPVLGVGRIVGTVPLNLVGVTLALRRNGDDAALLREGILRIITTVLFCAKFFTVQALLDAGVEHLVGAHGVGRRTWRGRSGHHEAVGGVNWGQLVGEPDTAAGRGRVRSQRYEPSRPFLLYLPDLQRITGSKIL